MNYRVELDEIHSTMLQELYRYFELNNEKKTKKEIIQMGVAELHAKIFDQAKQFQLKQKEREFVYMELLNIVAKPFNELIQRQDKMMEFFNILFDQNNRLYLTEMETNIMTQIFMKSVLYGRMTNTKEQLVATNSFETNKIYDLDLPIVSASLELAKKKATAYEIPEYNRKIKLEQDLDE